MITPGEIRTRNGLRRWCVEVDAKKKLVYYEVLDPHTGEPCETLPNNTCRMSLDEWQSMEVEA